MENASKALIIAGAILISILLISVGVIIMNSTGNTQETVRGAAQSSEIKSFNAQFTPYEGEDQSAAQIRSLKAAVYASNGAHKDHQVTYTEKETIVSTRKYPVTLNYDPSKGYVIEVVVGNDVG